MNCDASSDLGDLNKIEKFKIPLKLIKKLTSSFDVMKFYFEGKVFTRRFVNYFWLEYRKIEKERDKNIRQKNLVKLIDEELPVVQSHLINFSAN